MIKLKFKDNKGFILVASYMVIALLVILATGFATRSIGEQRVANKERDSVQAFWLAEAGVDKAISNLPSFISSGQSSTTFSEQLDSGKKYYVVLSETSVSNRFLITSTGGVPDINESVPDNVIRKITAIVEQPVQASPGDITSAITANGDVVVMGSAEVNGPVDPNASFNFEEIIGLSKEIVKDNATNYYTDPENNITPVNALTWANLVTIEEMTISDNNWQGSGILVVDGDLRITGGHFSGIIWVIGTLWVSGNPIIDGSIFVESGAQFETTVTGNPTVSFDQNAVDGALDTLSAINLPPRIISWKEN